MKKLCQMLGLATVGNYKDVLNYPCYFVQKENPHNIYLLMAEVVHINLIVQDVVSSELDNNSLPLLDSLKL